jgi:hypothetical protein
MGDDDSHPKWGKYFPEWAKGIDDSLHFITGMELLTMSHRFPRGSKEWLIVATAAHKLMLISDGPRPGRPPRSRPKSDVRLALLFCVVTGVSPHAAAKSVDRILNGMKRGAKNRIEYLAKRTKRALATLPPAEAEELAAAGHRLLTATDENELVAWWQLGSFLRQE